jgi:hypothetical protein
MKNVILNLHRNTSIEVIGEAATLIGLFGAAWLAYLAI